MTTLQTIPQYATALGVSERQVRRYLADDRLPGAVKLDGSWAIPTGTVPTAAMTELVTLTSPDVTPTPHGVVVPPGLWELEDVATLYGTDVGAIRRMVADGLLGVIGRYGPGPGRPFRLYVAPR